MTNLECIEYASKYSFKRLYEKGLRDGATKIMQEVFPCYYKFGYDCSICGAKDECIKPRCEQLLGIEEVENNDQKRDA